MTPRDDDAHLSVERRACGVFGRIADPLEIAARATSRVGLWPRGRDPAPREQRDPWETITAVARATAAVAAAVGALIHLLG